VAELHGRYMAFDEQGQPWGVLNIGGEEDLEMLTLEKTDRKDFAHYLVGERNLSASTAFTYEQGLMRFERFSGLPAEDATVEETRRFLRESDYNPATKNATLVALKAYHRWGAHLEKRWKSKGVEAVVGPKQVRQPKPCLSPEEAAELIAVCKRPNEYRLVYLGLYGGLRISEAASIGEAEWLADRLRFVGKGRKRRDVPIVRELQSVKGQILANETTAGTMKHVVRSLSHVTGVQFTSHTLRRTFAVSLSEKGVPREVIGTLLGHAPVSVTETYAPVRWQELVDAMEELEYPVKARLT
jgi:site-specific recombinase XerD